MLHPVSASLIMAVRTIELRIYSIELYMIFCCIIKLAIKMLFFLNKSAVLHVAILLLCTTHI